MNGEVTADINLLSTAQPKNFFFEQAFNNAISAHRCQRLCAGMNKSLELGFKAELLRPLAGASFRSMQYILSPRTCKAASFGLIPGATNLQPSFGIMGLHSDQRRNSGELASIRFS